MNICDQPDGQVRPDLIQLWGYLKVTGISSTRALKERAGGWKNLGRHELGSRPWMRWRLTGGDEQPKKRARLYQGCGGLWTIMCKPQGFRPPRPVVSSYLDSVLIDSWLSLLDRVIVQIWSVEASNARSLG